MADDQPVPIVEYRETYSVAEVEAMYVSAAGDFLLAMVRLEGRVDQLLMAATARAGAEEQFRTVWLDGMTLGGKLARLREALNHRGLIDGVKDAMSDLADLQVTRNHIAHRNPALGLGDAATFHFWKGNRQTVLSPSKLQEQAALARRLTVELMPLQDVLRQAG